MSKSLLEQLPSIVANGKRQAQQILEHVEGRHRVSLQTRELVVPARDTRSPDLFRVDRSPRSEEEAEWHNRLIYGDNLLAMAALLAGDGSSPGLAGQIDLVYIDPPFDSRADYRTKVELPGTTIDQRPTVLEQFAYSDYWADGTASYLAAITPRLALIRELLHPNGSLFVHLDWHVGHYVKIILDDIFGPGTFTNEIVWWYYNKMQGNIKTFPRNHDVILYYRKSGDFTFNKQEEERDKPVKQIKRVWSKEKGSIVNAKDENGKVIYVESTHRTVDDVWRLSMLQPADKKENLRFNTQKPESVLERIIGAATNEGDLVADFYVGSGTTAAVAERLGRRWIASDLGKPASMITRKRLIDQDAGPFLYQAIGDYQAEQARSTLGRSFRVGDLARVVLQLYGAVPLPPEANTTGNLGRLPETKTLVLADSPARLTTVTTLRRAQQLRETVMGGFDKVVVLGWNFAAGIGQDVAALSDPRLEVLVIPPDLLDNLKKKGSFENLAGAVRFSSLQYLEAEVSGCDRSAEDHDTVNVTLNNYVLLSPEAINLDEKNRQELQEVMNAEPLALIEYWAVDPDFDGEVFRSIWQDYRGNVDNDDDPLRVVTQAAVRTPKVQGERRVCIRAVDVFGFESEVVATISETPG